MGIRMVISEGGLGTTLDSYPINLKTFPTPMGTLAGPCDPGHSHPIQSLMGEAMAVMLFMSIGTGLFVKGLLSKAAS
jgi:hypothetical protein